MQGIVIAGTHSGCGKTTITLGILAALKKKGFSIQAFKAGPDFIDAGLHRLITGRHSRNLDLWMCGESYVKDCFCRNSVDADVSVVEGVMGLYDGEFSTARLAGVLGLPVILVVDAYGMAESAGAVVKGFKDFRAQNTEHRVQSTDKENKNLSSGFCALGSDFLGVIFNRVASEKHYQRLKNSVHDVPVLGYLPRDLSFEIPHRHLGLQVAEENPVAEENISRLADAVLKYIDVDAAIKSQSVKVSKCQSVKDFDTLTRCHSDTNLKIAVAYDKAFCFYYADNLDLLRENGAEIVSFSPLSDLKLPDKISAVYIGGGYPELYAKLLSENKSMLKSIFQWADSGKPLYAECGGLMYLSEGIYDFDGEFYKMAGVFSFETKMTKGRAFLGYREVLLKEDCILGRRGDKLKGHEFHYSEIDNRAKSTEHRAQTDDSFSYLNPRTLESRSESPRRVAPTVNPYFIYSVNDGTGNYIYDEGCRVKNTLASYVHVHFGSNCGNAGEIINFIMER